MPRAVPPGGRYFWMSSYYNTEGISVGQPVAFESAVASAAAPTTRDVIDFHLPDDLPGPSWPREGPPFLMGVTGGAEGYIELLLSYDQGFWDDHPGYPDMGWGSKLLVALYGDGVGDVGVEEGAPVRITHYISQDGGQAIWLEGPSGYDLDARITRIVIWRVHGDPLPGTAEEFWTSFVGSREIV